MGTWPTLYGMRGASAQGGLVHPTNPRGLEVTAGSAANTKSAGWLEILPALARPACQLWVQLQKGPTNNFDHLVDLAIGAPGSEMPLINNLIFSEGPVSIPETGTIYDYCFPLALPAGARLSVKSQCSASGSRTLFANVIAVLGSWYDQPWTRVITVGAKTSLDSGGEEVSPDAVASPPWAVLTTGLTSSLHGFVIGLGRLGDTNPTGRRIRMEIGIGSPGSEVVNATYFFEYLDGGGGQINPPTTPFISAPILAGTPISVRMGSSFATGTHVDVVFYGLAA